MILYNSFEATRLRRKISGLKTLQDLIKYVGLPWFFPNFTSQRPRQKDQEYDAASNQAIQTSSPEGAQDQSDTRRRHLI